MSQGLSKNMRKSWEYEEELNDTTKKSQLIGVMFIYLISSDLPCETEFEEEWNRS